MAVTREDVLKVAELAKLHIPEEELDTFIQQFNEIIEHVNKLNELDTKDVPPTSHVLDIKNVVREDKAAKPFPREEMLKNAPEHDEEYIKVPKVIPD